MFRSFATRCLRTKKIADDARSGRFRNDGPGPIFPNRLIEICSSFVSFKVQEVWTAVWREEENESQILVTGLFSK